MMRLLDHPLFGILFYLLVLAAAAGAGALCVGGGEGAMPLPFYGRM